MSAAALIKVLRSHANPKKSIGHQIFFKTGKGQYAEGDQFWGITVPQTRLIAKQFRDLPVSETIELLRSPIHELRSCALMILVLQYPKNPNGIFKATMANLSGINNWDLVDGSAPNIVGRHLHDAGDFSLLDKLAGSPDLWKRRIAMVATQYFLRQKDPNPTLRIAKVLLGDKQDLIHKASGWMLREMGKHCSERVLRDFLDIHGAQMPRTMLRYAIERLSVTQKKRYMAMGKRP